MGSFFLQDIGINVVAPMKMHCDNQAAIFIGIIANNPVFHERTKHIEIDCHLVQNFLLKKDIITAHICLNNQLGDILTKALARVPFHFLSFKLGMLDMYAPA